MVATEDIAEGTEILRDSPVVSAKKPWDVVDILLTTRSADIIWLLKYDTFSDEGLKWDATDTGRCEELAKKHGLDYGWPLQLYSRVCSVNLTLGAKRDHLGIYKKLACVNHSCDASAKVVEVTEELKNLTAVRRIHQGDQITFNYFDTEGLGIDNAELYRLLFREMFGRCCHIAHLTED